MTAQPASHDSGIEIGATAPLQVARPTVDLNRAEDFWRRGVGLEVLWRTHPTTTSRAAISW